MPGTPSGRSAGSGARLGLVLVVLLSAPGLVGMDCWGGTNECDPPDGANLFEEALYCRSGVRGFCREGGHQGDTVWEARPCPDGSTCTMRNDRAVCLLPNGTEVP
ncbi:MAG: hypothetical protein HY907_21535 [Deltaproteobacteria bacterium]|nr:hypothetical protein [Deltaproteobacteria bacterium]